MFSTNFFVLLFFIAIVGSVQSQNGEFGFFEKLHDLDKSLSPKQREEVREIGTNSSATKQEIIDNLKEFFHGIGGDLEKKFNAAAEMYRLKIAEISKKIKENQSTFNDEKAKEIFEKAGKIHQNMNITFAEEQKQIKSILETAPSEVKRKLEHIFWHSSSQHHKAILSN
uniref:DUF148 domain-containing protein n=1 Tax=Panagrolaimus sp. ES5 TaxID=591445 RepID=A0AC34F5C7_9BILA